MDREKEVKENFHDIQINSRLAVANRSRNVRSSITKTDAVVSSVRGVQTQMTEGLKKWPAKGA